MPNIISKPPEGEMDLWSDEAIAHDEEIRSKVRVWMETLPQEQVASLREADARGETARIIAKSVQVPVEELKSFIGREARRQIMKNVRAREEG